MKSELDNAYLNLTLEQMRAIEKLWPMHSISHIACKLGLTRSFVQSYVREKNSK